jgi:hypothetical protein
MKFNLQSKLGAWAMIALLFLAIVPVTGCAVTAAEIQADGAAVGKAMLSVAEIEESTNPALAQNLTLAANSLIAATANWQTGSSTAIINNALNVAEVALAAIPQTAAIAPLIPIAEAALDILVANINPNAVSTTHLTARYSLPSIHHRLGRSPKGDFISAWNGVVNAHPKLASARQ